MSGTLHELAAEFPDFTTLVHYLQQTDGHFARLCRSYEELSRRVHQVEKRNEPAGDAMFIDMCKQRRQLKDEIYGMLVQPEPEAEVIKLAV
jgi:uncharacterized protein YdcH (DUF465 family)